MAVAGKRLCEGFSCFLCNDHGNSNQADGFCIQCSDYLCKTCFENHTKWRVAKDHTFGSENETSPKAKQEGLLEFDKCSKHVNESIKFYCSAHDQVGCGDCMILEHKPCTIEYVHKKADAFKESQEYFCFNKRISKCQERANQLKPSIQKSKEEITEENDMFVKDVHKFKDEIIACVTKLADATIQEANKIKMHDTQKMNDLESQRENAGTDINAMHNAVDMLADQPNKLFVTAIQQKPILKEIERRLDDIERRWKFEHYYFDREAQFERVLKKGAVLGTLQTRKDNSDTQDANNKTSARSVIQETETDHAVAKPADNIRKPQSGAQQKPQLLIENKRSCSNIAIDGDYLSYDGNGTDVGQYVYIPQDKSNFYFEVEIVNTGQRGEIVIGVVQNGYPKNLPPGYGDFSVGYNTNDGKLYNESRKGKTIGPKCKAGDIVGCSCSCQRVSAYFQYCQWKVVFTLKGKQIGETSLYDFAYPAIGLCSEGSKVKVILDAKRPY